MRLLMLMFLLFLGTAHVYSRGQEGNNAGKVDHSSEQESGTDEGNDSELFHKSVDQFNHYCKAAGATPQLCATISAGFVFSYLVLPFVKTFKDLVVSSMSNLNKLKRGHMKGVGSLREKVTAIVLPVVICCLMVYQHGDPQELSFRVIFFVCLVFMPFATVPTLYGASFFPIAYLAMYPAIGTSIRIFDLGSAANMFFRGTAASSPVWLLWFAFWVLGVLISLTSIDRAAILLQGFVTYMWVLAGGPAWYSSDNFYEASLPLRVLGTWLKMQDDAVGGNLFETALNLGQLFRFVCGVVRPPDWMSPKELEKLRRKAELEERRRKEQHRHAEEKFRKEKEQTHTEDILRRRKAELEERCRKEEEERRRVEEELRRQTAVLEKYQADEKNQEEMRRRTADREIYVVNDLTGKLHVWEKEAREDGDFFTLCGQCPDAWNGEYTSLTEEDVDLKKERRSNTLCKSCDRCG